MASTTAPQAMRIPSAVRTAVTRDPARSSAVTGLPYRNRTPAASAAAASASGSARIPPRGKYTPATVSM